MFVQVSQENAFGPPTAGRLVPVRCGVADLLNLPLGHVVLAAFLLHDGVQLELARGIFV